MTTTLKKFINFATLMKVPVQISVLILLTAFLFSSCVKKESPYPLPPKGNANNAVVNIGTDYGTEIFFSFSTGIVDSSQFEVWDIAFNSAPDQNEVWMNGGKNVLIYATGQSNFSYELPSGIPESEWKYDEPAQLPGESGMGTLTPENHMGELLIVKIGNDNYKLKILNATATAYTIETGAMSADEGTTIVLEKDPQYNFLYFSFTRGEVHPAPPKTDWDVVFTRYRTIFKGINEDGSDMPYLVNGVLTNPYKTTSGDDSLQNYDFETFTREDAEKFTLYPDRDVIGYDWKLVNINTAEYTVLPKRIFVVCDQHNQLWKLHFVSFYGPDGEKGQPQFEYKRLE